MLNVVHPVESEVSEPGLNIVHAHFPRAHPTTACVRMDAGESAVWKWLELGFVVTLALSGFLSILLFLTGAGNI